MCELRIGRLGIQLMALAMFLNLAACASSSTKDAASKTEAVGGDPWFRAARTSDVPMLKGMVQGGYDINKTSGVGLTGLMVASRAGTPETIKWFLDNGADAKMLDRDGQSALVYALVGLANGPKRARIVEDLLKAGADPFKVDRLGFQPVREMIDLEMDEQIRQLNYTEKRKCDRVPTVPGEPTLSRLARRAENVKLAEFFEAQGCW